jgi:hypothetical protein
VIGRPLGAEGANPCDLDECRSALWVVGRACLLMILFSVVASVVGTVLLNLLLR